MFEHFCCSKSELVKRQMSGTEFTTRVVWLLSLGFALTCAVAKPNELIAQSTNTATTPSSSESSSPDTPSSALTSQSKDGQLLPQQPSTSQTQNQPVLGPDEQSQLPNQEDLEQKPMTAEQIIGLLQADSNLRASVKDRLAQLPGIDPNSITDQALYQRLREDPAARQIASQELRNRGYDFELPESESPGTTAKPATANRNAVSGETGSTGPAAQNLPAANVPEPPGPDTSQAKRQRSPYPNLPSVGDLYSQFPETRKPLRRFGSDAFRVGTGNADALPADLPAGPDYVLGPGDALIVNMWGGRSGRLETVIDRQGQVSLPEAGAVMIGGMTIEQAQAAIQRALDTQFRGEHAEISLGKVRSVRIYVVGDVQRPGAYDVSSLSTPLSALYAAGGPTSRGSLRILRQYRGQQLVRQIDLYDFLLKGVRAADERLEAGDTILVPTVGPQVSVDGAVRRPAIYELNDEKDLSQIVNLAGGVPVSGSLKQIEVERIEAHESRTMMSLQLPDDATQAQQKLAAFEVKDGDSVLIKQILPYNEQAVYLNGHVFHPGKYAYHDGMTVADLLHSYQDVLPEPNDRAELVRLQSPDFHPEATSFSLSDALIGNVSIPLKPFDVIRVYGRYEVDAPKVTINGDVIRPGDYPMSQGMTAADLIRMAGGFKRSAYRDEADLSSYVVQDAKQVLVSNRIVEAQKALDGDKTADAQLKPGDVLNIRTLAGWQDIGATVTITGEVEHAGKYGIQIGERLSSVLKRAGGLRADAYPYASDFERVQVRELAEQARLKMIQRIQDMPVNSNPAALNTQTSTALSTAMQAQRQQILAELRTNPSSGRMVINITSDISKWENTPADIQLREGDTLNIPKQPSFVAISGQVYNPIAISYVPGKNLSWYLRKAGGPTPSANKKDIYVLHADGSVVPRGSGFLKADFSDIPMRRGDVIFVPEKIVGPSATWQNILGAAQIASAAALPLAVAGVL